MEVQWTTRLWTWAPESIIENEPQSPGAADDEPEPPPATAPAPDAHALGRRRRRRRVDASPPAISFGPAAAAHAPPGHKRVGHVKQQPEPLGSRWTTDGVPAATGTANVESLDEQPRSTRTAAPSDGGSDAGRRIVRPPPEHERDGGPGP